MSSDQSLTAILNVLFPFSSPVIPDQSPVTSESTSQDLSVIHLTDLAEADQSSLFESLPSVEYRKLEEEFDKIAALRVEEEAREAKRTQTARPTDLNLPQVRPADSWKGSSPRTPESPETPSYSSRPLPLSPNGPQIANISLTSPDRDTFAKVFHDTLDMSSDVDEFQDELQFDPTISSGHCGVLGGGFRATPVTVGVCPTPQPASNTPRPEQQTPPPVAT